MIIKNRMIISSIFGLLLAIFGTLYFVHIDVIFKFTLKKMMILQPNTFVTNLWQNPPVRLEVDLYIFNWTNSDDYHNHSIKPKFEELGPYHFIEKPHKINIVWHPENGTVSYDKKPNYYFDETKSVGQLNDTIIGPNLVAMSLYNKIKYWSPMKRSLIEMALKMDRGNGVSMTRTVDELLFAGFDTTLIRLKRMVPISIPDLDIPYEKIGYGYPRNDTAEIYGHHNIYTGANDFSKMGQIAEWRYSNISQAYPQCDLLKGSPGEFQKIPLVKGEPISYFVPDICREFEVDYADTTQVDGIDGYLYEGSLRNVANGTDNESNSCYCSGDCVNVPSGLQNVSTCWYNAPIFASYPHFYNADPFYVEQVDGMKPNKSLHSLSVVLEPMTGFVLDLKARLMASMLVEPVNFSSTFRKARRTFFPLLWVDYRTHITPDLAFYVKLLPISIIVGKIFGLLCAAVGVIMIAWYPSKLYWQSRYVRKIEISCVENKVQTVGREQKHCKNYAEVSPLLIGLEYVAKGENSETESNQTETTEGSPI